MKDEWRSFFILGVDFFRSSGLVKRRKKTVPRVGGVVVFKKKEGVQLLVLHIWFFCIRIVLSDRVE